MSAALATPLAIYHLNRLIVGPGAVLGIWNNVGDVCILISIFTPNTAWQTHVPRQVCCLLAEHKASHP